ncbi:MAG: nucleotide exchange factor GrpE [Nocardioidaceae bacterium]|nr:nucleotide exchange factor GrpE [Nocardioidaceae bacterium]
MTSDHEAPTHPDPDQGDAVTEPDVEGEQPSASAGVEDELRAQLADRTLDLQRLQAEYLNYKRRVDRDREVIKAGAAAQVLSSLLPVLDDLGRADEHGELQGGFKAVADSLRQAVTSHGLEAFGTDGDPFDPNVHEALMHGYSDDVEVTTADKVLQTGYRVGDRVLRPARVSVVEPSEPSAAPDGAADDAQA